MVIPCDYIEHTHTLKVTITKRKFDLKLNSKGSRGPYSVRGLFQRSFSSRPNCKLFVSHNIQETIEISMSKSMDDGQTCLQRKNGSSLK